MGRGGGEWDASPTLLVGLDLAAVRAGDGSRDSLYGYEPFDESTMLGQAPATPVDSGGTLLTGVEAGVPRDGIDSTDHSSALDLDQSASIDAVDFGPDVQAILKKYSS